jgi:hypothetical protein
MNCYGPKPETLNPGLPSAHAHSIQFCPYFRVSSFGSIPLSSLNLNRDDDRKMLEKSDFR